ncbi:outer membrane beta-barrel protein [Pseudoduganella sp.]|uniref:outer membrane beta-barrel protein n=1 Tax=Pseudoduganella sp. TaxID=1880898 RepID=UPI0035B068CC
MQFIRSIAAASLLLFALPSFAQTPAAQGVYLSADFGRASVSSRYADDGSDVALSGAIGYQYSSSLGFELYSRGLSLNPFRGAFDEAGYYPDRHYGLAAIAGTNVSEAVRLFGRAGVGRTTMKGNRTRLADKHDTDPILGVGASYALSRNWSLNVEASYLTKSEVSLLTLGARVQF